MNRATRTAKNPARKHWLQNRTKTRQTRWLQFQRELMTSRASWISDGTKWVRDPNDEVAKTHAKWGKPWNPQ